MTAMEGLDVARLVGFVALGVVVLMLSWDPPLLGPLAGLSFDWSNWNASDIRPMLDLHDWPCDPHNKLTLAQSILPFRNATGPESLAFDNTGSGPYTGVADGRILRWDPNQAQWLTFGVTSPIRTEVCDEYPASIDNEHVCGRPLGLRFDEHGNLYIADAYFGLVVMGPEGGVAKAVSTQAEGVPFKFVNDLDFDENGTVYFTDSSARRPRRQCNLVTMEQDRSGRVLKYDPKTQQTTVMARDLFYPNGIAVSHDSSFLLLSHTSKSRIGRLWLKGTKAGVMEEFAVMPGFPDNIRRTKEGDFWVALHSRMTKLQYFFANHWHLLRLLYSLPLKFDHIAAFITGPPDAMVVKLNPNGEAVEAFEDRSGKHASFVSFAEERNGLLWMSSIYLPKIWVLPLSATTTIL